MKGSVTLKDFLIGVVATMAKENSHTVEADMTLPDGTRVTFEITVLEVIKP